MTIEISLQEWLIDRGLTPQEADLWSEFIADALALLVDGHALLRELSEWNSFLLGCRGPNPTEPEITSGLGDRMKRLRNDSSLDSSRDRVYVNYEHPIQGDERHGTRKFKADFHFERKFDAGFSAEFVIEAKPLRILSDIAKRYMAADGIGCFIERSPPYSRALAVGMLGYAYTRPDAWMSALAVNLNGNSTATRSGSVKIADDIAAFVSDHTRTGLGLVPVTILHSILDFACPS